MRKLRNTVTAILTLALLSFFAAVAQASDVQVNPTGQSFPINGLIWGQSVGMGFNNNFFFSPLFPSGSVCVYVYNNNPTNAHTFTVQVAYTGDPTSTGPSTGTWNNYSTSVFLNVSAAPSGPAVVGAAISGASQISINFSGSAVQAGSPDTANVRIVQTSGQSCTVTGSSNARSLVTGSLVSDTTGQASERTIAVISDAYATAFVATSGTVTNPALNQVIVGWNTLNAGKFGYFDRASVTCSAACSIYIGIGTVGGSSCSAVTPTNLKLGITSPPTTTGAAYQACGGNPTTTHSIDYSLTAGQTALIDLTGIIATYNGATQGNVNVQMAAALTGTVTANLYWYEK
jgi:hypothetical protein